MIACAAISTRYDANASTVLRRTHTDYNLGANYLSTTRRLIGLPDTKLICDGAGGETPCTSTSGSSLVSKMSFQYDEAATQNQGSPVQHDDNNFSVSYYQGRGNLTSTRRY